MASRPKKEGPTSQERALTETSAAQWNDYVQRFIPAEEALADRIQVTDSERADVRGQVSGDVAGAFKGLARSTTAANEAVGAKAGSTKSRLAIAANSQSKSSAVGKGLSTAEIGIKINEDEQKLQLAGIGRGVTRDATANLAQGAQRAVRGALAQSAARFARNQALLEAAGTVAGASTRKFGGDLFSPELQEIDLDGIDNKRKFRRYDDFQFQAPPSNSRFA